MKGNNDPSARKGLPPPRKYNSSDGEEEDESEDSDATGLSLSSGRSERGGGPLKGRGLVRNNVNVGGRSQTFSRKVVPSVARDSIYVQGKFFMGLNEYKSDLGETKIGSSDEDSN